MSPATETLVLHPYAGAGGMSQGAALAGVDDIGIEHDPAACATRAAAGHRTIRADAATFPLDHLAGQVDGLIVTPPCQAFSAAGNGAGRDVIPDLTAAISHGHWAWSHDDDRVRHVLEVGRWAETLRPRWIVCEQVPPVLPVWRAYADRWRRAHGWSCWAGVLCAADHGVPQTRRRAFLIARTDGRPPLPPSPTHCDGGALTFDGELAPWVTMADAVGWGGEDTPARTIAGNRTPRWMYPDSDGTHGRVLDRRQQSAGIAGAKSQWVFHRPATTVTGDARITARCHHDAGSQGARAVTVEQAMTGDYDGTSPIRLTIRDALILQGFDADYPVQGTRTAQFRQIGDAVPPPLAAAVIRTLA